MFQIRSLLGGGGGGWPPQLLVMLKSRIRAHIIVMGFNSVKSASL